MIIDTSKPLSELILDLQKKYKDEDDQSQMFQKLYLEKDNDSYDSQPLNQYVQKKLNITESRQAKRQKKAVQKEEISKQSTQSSSEEISKRRVLDPSITDKKTIQMIRNRISAQNSRDRKKAYVQQLEIENCKQSYTIQQLEEQVQSLQIELQESQKQQSYLQQVYFFQYILKFLLINQQLQNLACLNCGNTNIGYNEDVPLKISKSRGLGLGVGFITLLSIICLFSLSQQSQQLRMEQFTSRVVNETEIEYKLLKTIQENHKNPPTSIIDINEIYKYNFDSTYRAIPHEEFSIRELINKKRQSNALVTLESQREISQVDSLYCPSAYKFQDNPENQIKVTFQDGQWIHLVVPRDKINIFYESAETQITLTDYIHPKKPQMSEIWCQVKQVNDLYI